MDIVNQLMNLRSSDQDQTEQNKNAVDDEIIQDDTFSYEGYQVVRGEFFAHMHEPSVTLNANKIYVNKACLKKLPEVEYIQFLMNKEEKKLVLRPCTEDSKDGFRWCTVKGTNRIPRQISCRVFFAMVIRLMGWNSDYRYKMLGKIIRSGDEKLIVFDLTARETYRRVIKDGEKPKFSRTPIFPEEWENQFGLPVEEHRKQLQINIFEGYTVFTLKDEKQGCVDEKPEEEITEGATDQ